MKNLDYYVQLNLIASDKNTYLSLIQTDISGGRISKQAIDRIRQYPSITEISISGLTQDTFDYFIENYGHQFKAIMFWKCPLVAELSKIELLDQVEYILMRCISGIWKIKAHHPKIIMMQPDIACTCQSQSSNLPPFQSSNPKPLTAKSSNNLRRKCYGKVRATRYKQRARS
jgi:hypothetical protein